MFYFIYEVKTKQTAFVNRNCATLAPLYIFLANAQLPCKPKQRVICKNCLCVCVNIIVHNCSTQHRGVLINFYLIF